MKTKALTNVTVYTGNEVIENGYILHNEKILEVGTMSDANLEGIDCVDGEGKIVIPGMIDVHVHGGYNIDTMDGEVDRLLQLSEKLLNEGVTSFFPTTMTQDPKEITHAIKACVAAKKKGANIEGIHLEGPFVSLNKVGAQPESFIIKPDMKLIDDWYQASEGLLNLVTFAPEEQANHEFEEYFDEKGIVGSAGHCDATYDFLSSCKVKHYTHLYNQMRGLHHREPGVVGKALLDDSAYVEIIVDGIHVHPEMVKLAYKLKGADKICLITDAMCAKGLGDGHYHLGGQTVIVKGKEAKLLEGTYAGSVLKMDQALRNVIDYTGCSLEEGVRMASVNQAKEFKLEHKGGIQAGKDADFILMDTELNITATVSRGSLHEVE